MQDRQQNLQQRQKTQKEGSKFWENVRYVCTWAYKLRSILLSIPVVVAAIVLAIRNMAKLPAEVGLNLQASGEYAMTVSRGVAVFVPLAVTGVCLLLMFCSRRVVYPWLISLFSLVLPIVILILNTFPY